MNERVRAAAEAIWLNSSETVLHEEHYRDARSALAAADAVMFSDAAVDLIARTLFEESGRDWDIQPSGVKSRWLKRGRTVVSALKGAGDE